MVAKTSGGRWEGEGEGEGEGEEGKQMWHLNFTHNSNDALHPAPLSATHHSPLRYCAAPCVHPVNEAVRVPKSGSFSNTQCIDPRIHTQRVSTGQNSLGE